MVRNRGNAPSRERALVDLPPTLNLVRPSQPRHWRAAPLEAVKQAWRSPVKLDLPQACLAPSRLAPSFLAPNRLADGREGQATPARRIRPARRDAPQAVGERSSPPAAVIIDRYWRSTGDPARAGAAIESVLGARRRGRRSENAARPRPRSFSSRDEIRKRLGGAFAPSFRRLPSRHSPLEPKRVDEYVLAARARNAAAGATNSNCRRGAIRF
jgi:hypothetical protein